MRRNNTSALRATREQSANRRNWTVWANVVIRIRSNDRSNCAVLSMFTCEITRSSLRLGSDSLRQLHLFTSIRTFCGAHVYERFFGKPLSVSHELLPVIPHIDVYTFKRSQADKEVYSLVTGGMSDLEMTLPRGADRDVPRRAELIFYCSEPREEYIATLRWVAHFPHNSKSWLGHGHTMPNGDPPAPFWGSTELDTLFFLPPIVK